MFTGIVEEIGLVLSIKDVDKSKVIKIKCKKVIEDIDIGDSICTNGVCLTATKLGKDYFIADVMMESLKLSNISKLKEGDSVNLERALSVNGRLNGHIVSGHIDGMGTIIGAENHGNSTVIKVECSNELLQYMVCKGSVTLDGTSLTISSLKENYFEVSIIPHTKDESIIFKKNIGQAINIECDMLLKYIKRLMDFSTYKSNENNITLNLLKENGFI
ncbi:riboflavin synthase [Clostridium sp. ATCC 25772]|uniref:Riboflavin synthase n=1 Tax=Clostridium senegalense TaxID=1465809 RepID=A0A6M0H046_9CLOT|nr:riboflavin synthase [Clostridium sp. ATCC 25772]NEU04125.1 riboflavin synthase [Clostridium senegalense]